MNLIFPSLFLQVDKDTSLAESAFDAKLTGLAFDNTCRPNDLEVCGFVQLLHEQFWDANFRCLKFHFYSSCCSFRFCQSLPHPIEILFDESATNELDAIINLSIVGKGKNNNNSFLLASLCSVLVC